MNKKRKVSPYWQIVSKNKKRIIKTKDNKKRGKIKKKSKIKRFKIKSIARLTRITEKHKNRNNE